MYLGAQLIQLVLVSLYLQHHFAALGQAVSFLVLHLLTEFGLAPTIIPKNIIAAAACPRHEAITATFSIERHDVLEILTENKMKRDRYL